MNYNTRCSICNHVSSEDIQTELGDFTKGEFVPDPKNELHFICIVCKEVFEEQMLAYEAKDDPYSWLDPDVEVGLDQPFAPEIETEETDDEDRND